jgi:hypothetical protein
MKGKMQPALFVLIAVLFRATDLQTREGAPTSVGPTKEVSCVV